MLVGENSRIRNPQRAKQLIDFKGLSIDGNIYPTDIDGLIEYHDSEYIIFEIKYDDAKMPRGQRLALERMARALTEAGKQAVVFVCEHKVKDKERPVIAANCDVREMYYGCKGVWEQPDKKLKADEAVTRFHEYAKYFNNQHN